MIKIAEILPPKPCPLWQLVKQCGVDHVVGMMEAGQNRTPWDFLSLVRMKTAYQDNGFKLAVIESRPPMDKIKLGLPGRDEQIKDVCALIRNMGALDIPVWCYEWMPLLNWTRTSDAVPARGGALVTAYDHQLMLNAPSVQSDSVNEDQLWDNLHYFLERVIPVAQAANVKLAMHPDDPPISPIQGTTRIMGSIESFQRLLDLLPSPVNGIAICQGNFTLMTDDLPSVIRRFGDQQKIFYVHFRDVRGTRSKFVETFHDNGQTDMAACMTAYRDIGYQGVCRPDHVPTMTGDDNDRPGYSHVGRLYAIGYIRGLREAVYAGASSAQG